MYNQWLTIRSQDSKIITEDGMEVDVPAKLRIRWICCGSGFRRAWTSGFYEAKLRFRRPKRRCEDHPPIKKKMTSKNEGFTVLQTKLARLQHNKMGLNI